jgi:hypothetical protein
MSASQRWLIHDFFCSGQRFSFPSFLYYTNVHATRFGTGFFFQLGSQDCCAHDGVVKKEQDASRQGNERDALCLALCGSVQRCVNLVMVTSMPAGLAKRPFSAFLYYWLVASLSSSQKSEVCLSSWALAASGKHIRAIFRWTEYSL